MSSQSTSPAVDGLSALCLSNNVSYTLLSTCNHEMGSVAIRLSGCPHSITTKIYLAEAV